LPEVQMKLPSCPTSGRQMLSAHDALMDHAPEEEHGLGPTTEEVGRKHPGFPRLTYEWVVSWMHLYYHLM
jgi:hypothetical protein